MICDDGDFDSPQEAEAFRASLCPTCEGFGEIWVGPGDGDFRACPTCGGSGTTNPQH